MLKLFHRARACGFGFRGRPFGLETLASTADLLSLSRYLACEAEKFDNTEEETT